MHIKKITNQSRRDFRTIYQCEHCLAEEQGSGYDDRFFHSNVIPSMKCKKCLKTASDKYKALATKHSDNAVI